MGSNMEQHWQEQEATYGGSEYDINWEEVKAGRSSGMPGKWVRGEGEREGGGRERGREGGRGGISTGRRSAGIPGKEVREGGKCMQACLEIGEGQDLEEDTCRACA